MLITASYALRTAPSQRSMFRGQAQVQAKVRYLAAITRWMRSPAITLIRAMWLTVSCGPRKPTAAYSTALGAVIFAGDQRAAHSVLFWTLGGLGLARWENLPLAGLGLALVTAYALWRSAALDALLGGEEAAFSLGINPERLRVEVFGVCALASACFVALTGVIGFIGLMVPHLARGLAGALHRGVLWFSALLGAGLCVISVSLFCAPGLP